MEILSSIARHNNLARALAVNGFVAAAPAKRLELRLFFFFFFFFFVGSAPASESLDFFFFFILGGGAFGGGASGSPASGGGGPAGALMVLSSGSPLSVQALDWRTFGEIRESAAGSHRRFSGCAARATWQNAFASVLLR